MTTSLKSNFINSDSRNTCLLAAIDIGTNSIHMVVVEINKTLLTFTIINRQKDTVRLGEREAKTRKLTEEAIERAIASLKRCKDLANSLKVDHIVAIATSATREAPNGKDFIQRVSLEVGIEINLISGYEEARRIYLGVLSGMDFQDRPHVIIDIGGGSTEIILADVHEPRFLSSIKVGAVRLTEELITTDPVSETEFSNLRAYVRGMLERPIDELRRQLGDNEQPQLVGTSGTIETLVTINALQKLGEVPSPLQGYRMGRKEVKDLVKKFVSMTYEERLKISGMSDKRAEIIVAGGVILMEAMAMLTLDNITVCERALREGMIVDWMLNHKLIEDRLCYQGKVRHRSVYQIAHKYQVNMEYSERVAQFAQSLFEQLKGFFYDWGTKEWELLWAATILHKCGLYVNHSAYHKHSYYLIRNAELLGFTELELETIANLARYHRKSIPKKKHEPYSKLPDTYRKIVKQLSTILRLAVALNSRQIGDVKTINCKYNEKDKRLYLHLFSTDSSDECGLELWNLDYNKLVFENEFGVKVLATLN
ncbi:Ppx/GppA phosphatase family protein [cyanobacterium endosymbiont of Epithemia clementina EcSB]|uniref:Ppx/GppA phosphatase family protein n=1 Tax=cyanobacterium endosymbiont of Epithemia clementina EcSB TaxID=3034674 RepID=UPI00247FF8BD|nr:Ppx/GppA phosphatase family protein [cyanobacterium endosymbiont of Epithemia clementina EcSB]WGT67545.1 Ppx/GppA phosphatase family protein [cyanobacterium endosymbiont of Epithemia clementina EcSB]